MEWCLEMGIRELTVFALSTDNLKRAEVEVQTLMRLAKESFAKMAEKGGFLAENGIQVKILGDLDKLLKDVADSMRRTEELTKDHMAARLNVCLCYSSQEEILSAVD
jgi:ditrans,polycis-polyprenyl diphosphate synthase